MIILIDLPAIWPVLGSKIAQISTLSASVIRFINGNIDIARCAGPLVGRVNFRYSRGSVTRFGRLAFRS